MVSPNHAIIMLRLGQQIQKEQEGKYCNYTTPQNKNNSNKASKGRAQSKNSFVLHGSGMLHKICKSKLDRSQSQKELWHLTTQVIPKSLISLHPFQVQYHSKNTHASTLEKKAELKPCFSLSQLAPTLGILPKRENERRESAHWFSLDPEPDMTWKSSSTDLLKELPSWPS